MEKPRIRVRANADGQVVSMTLVSPGAEAGGLRAGMSMSGFEAGQGSRRLRSFTPPSSHINALLSGAGDTIVRRSRHLGRNNGFAKSGRDTFVAHAVGTGIKPSWLHDDAGMKKKIQETFLDWTDEADADGVCDYYGLQALAVSGLWDGGECFIRRRPRLLSDGLTVPLQLQLIEAEQLPLSKTEPAENGNAIRCGIEFDAIGRRVAYHFLRKHPGDATDPNVGQAGQYTRVPASEVIHLFEVLRPGQIRGVPRNSAAIVKLFLLDQYNDAELDRKKTAALFAGFITSPDDDAETAPVQHDSEGLAGLAPGVMMKLKPGEEISFSEPADVGGNFSAFEYQQLLETCAAMGLPYQNVTGDVLKANYSNIRAALLEHRRRTTQLQHHTIVFQLCRRVVRWFMDAAFLSGALDLAGYARNPRPWLRVKHIAPAWEWVDPLKDRKAEILAVRAGLKSRSDVIEAEGYDPEEVDARIAADNARADALGLVFDTDGRKVSGSGVYQALDTVTDPGTAGGDLPPGDTSATTSEAA